MKGKLYINNKYMLQKIVAKKVAKIKYEIKNI
jgi:hypothetical protein